MLHINFEQFVDCCRGVKIVLLCIICITNIIIIWHNMFLV